MLQILEKEVILMLHILANSDRYGESSKWQVCIYVHMLFPFPLPLFFFNVGYW